MKKLKFLIIPILFFLILFFLSHEAETPQEPVTEISSEGLLTETEESITSLSYVDEIALEYIDKPEKRTREEAVAKIRELARWYPAFYFVAENEAQYPIELLLSGAANPEMADYLYGYLFSDGTITGGFTDDEQPEDYPLFLQYDPRWGYLPYGSRGTVGSSGCGPACLSMAIFYLTGDRTCTPGVIAQYSLDNRYYIDGVGTSWNLLTEYPKQFGLSSYRVSMNEASMKAELDNGRYLICSARPGNFTSSGHFILIYGYDENGFKINDPKSVYRSRLSWTF